MVGLMALLLVTYTFHCTWVTSEAYSSPSIVLSAKQHDGSRVIFDDFREAYYWLRQNTPEVTWSWYFATRMLLRFSKLHRIVSNIELKSYCRGVCLFCEWFLLSSFFFFLEGGIKWCNCINRLQRQKRKWKRPDGTEPDFLLSICSSVIGQIGFNTCARLRHCCHVLFDKSTYLFILNRRAWPPKFLFIYFYLIISGIESNVMVGLRLSDNSHGEQDDISG